MLHVYDKIGMEPHPTPSASASATPTNLPALSKSLSFPVLLTPTSDWASDAEGSEWAGQERWRFLGRWRFRFGKTSSDDATYPSPRQRSANPVSLRRCTKGLVLLVSAVFVFVLFCVGLHCFVGLHLHLLWLNPFIGWENENWNRNGCMNGWAWRICMDEWWWMDTIHSCSKDVNVIWICPLLLDSFGSQESWPIEKEIEHKELTLGCDIAALSN